MNLSKRPSKYLLSSLLKEVTNSVGNTTVDISERPDEGLLRVTVSTLFVCVCEIMDHLTAVLYCH